mgnify:CR=1 FL=1
MSLTENIIRQSEMSVELKDFLDNLTHIEGSLYHGILPFETFIEIQSWIKQRKEEPRVQKSKTNHMNELKDPHLIIALGILTQDDTDDDGKLYKAGSIFILDANTRKWVWVNKDLDRLPQKLSGNVFKKETLKELHSIYLTYDSPDACETSGEALTGQYRVLGWNPESAKFVDGQIGTALNFASMWTYGAPQYGTNKGKDGVEVSESETKTEQSRLISGLQLQYFLPELKYLDKFNLKKANGIDPPLLTALLAATKAFKGNPHFDELVKSCNEREFVNGANTNALGKIMMAALQYTDEVYVRGGEAKYAVYRKAYNFYLYWIERYVKNESDRQTGKNLKGRQGGYDGDMIIRKDGSKNLKWDADKISYGKEFNQKYILPLDSNYLNHLFNVDNEDTD